jgi:hypothetical protein
MTDVECDESAELNVQTHLSRPQLVEAAESSPLVFLPPRRSAAQCLHVASTDCGSWDPALKVVDIAVTSP